MAYIMELANALKQEDPETRVRILKALMELKDPRATPSLLEALEDSCLEVRRAAMRALSWIGDERSRSAFIEALREGDFSLRFWAAIGLQKVGDVNAVEALIDALKDPDEGVRLQAVYALAEIGDRRAVDPLIEALDDEDAQVRTVARFRLREAFGVPVPSDYEEVKKRMREHFFEQGCLNEKLETVLKVIIHLEQAAGAVRDEELYQRLEAEHEIGEDEALDLLVQLMKKGLIDSYGNATRASAL
jgi:HEAT repeat protein